MDNRRYVYCNRKSDEHDASAIDNNQDNPNLTSNEEPIDNDETDSAILQYAITTTPCHVEPLYQEHPRIKSTFTRYTNWSLTDSLESYQNRAWKETVVLRRNNRVPTKEFVLHFLEVFSVKVISVYRTKIFRVLTDNGLEAVANIELTRDENGKPNNTVHFTILTDDQRREKELRKLLEIACERQGLVKSIGFYITYEPLYDGYGRFNYFAKYGEKYFFKVILFRKNTGLQKFYQIGKWFGKNKKMIWEEYIRERYSNDPDKIDRATIDAIPEIDCKPYTH